MIENGMCENRKRQSAIGSDYRWTFWYMVKTF